MKNLPRFYIAGDFGQLFEQINMVKWYNKSIEIITKRNILAILSFIFSMGFYAIKKVSDSETAGILGIALFSMGVGLFFPLINIKNREVLITALLFVSLGEQVGFHIGRLRAQKIID